MKIGVLTSSRADYGIYKPLLSSLIKDSYFQIEIIAFGTHLSKYHGYTIDEIIDNSYKTIHKITSTLASDDKSSIATSYGLTALKFAEFWNNYKYDLVLCLGDRFEMNAAVQAGIPFEVKFAHLHGGETTLGAIDDIYRDQISLASKVHFTATNTYRDHLIGLLGSNKNVLNIGSLSLADIENFKPIDRVKFCSLLKIEIPFVLVTFHPETVNPENNAYFAQESFNSLKKIAKRNSLLITMPNVDTFGSLFRERLIDLKNEMPQRVSLVENLGKKNYFSAMFYSKYLIGNTSSGIIEAASFGKYVINVGDRQKGRLQANNIINVAFSSKDIYAASMSAEQKGNYKGENPYYQKNSIKNVICYLKKLND